MFPKIKRKIAKFYFVLRPLSAIIFALIFLLLIFKTGPVIINSAKNLFSPFSLLLQIVFGRDIGLKRTDHRINIIILGMAGGSHEGSELTDTIIFSSIDPLKKDVLMISVPRDIWVDSMRAKINTAFYYGEEKRKGGGFILAKAAVSEIFDQPVDYAIKINFDGFKKIIDLLGGIDINIENSFTDKKYPIEGKENDNCDGNDPEYKCRYQTVHFERGKQHLNGTTALQFVRSRNAEGAEGSDFARSKRQQKVILAIKDKIFSLQTIFNPVKIKGLINIFGESIASDVKTEEIDDFLRLAKKLAQAKIRTLTLDVGDEKNGQPGLLINPPEEEYDGNWVLTPRSGDWKQIQEKIKEELIN